MIWLNPPRWFLAIAGPTGDTTPNYLLGKVTAGA